MATDVSGPFAVDIEDAKFQVETLENAYLKRWGWSQTCQTPGSYWLWRRDFTPDDEDAVVRWHERNEVRAKETVEHGRPHTPNGPNPPTGYGVVCVPKNLALSMTLSVLDDRAEEGDCDDD